MIRVYTIHPSTSSCITGKGSCTFVGFNVKWIQHKHKDSQNLYVDDSMWERKQEPPC